MAFASPSASSRTILSVRSTAIAAGTTNFLFNIPQDAGSIIAKFWTTAGFLPITTQSARCAVQTSEDGGTTWRDVAICTMQAAITNDQAHFAAIPTLLGTGKGVANWIGSVGSSSLVLAAVASVVNGVASGLPMMGTLGRVQVTITGTLDTGGVNVDIFAPTTGNP